MALPALLSVAPDPYQAKIEADMEKGADVLVNTAAGSALNFLRLQRVASSCKVIAKDPSSTTASSPLSNDSLGFSDAFSASISPICISPGSNPKELSPSPSTLSTTSVSVDGPMVFKPRFALVDDACIDIRSAIESGEMVSDEEIAFYFLQGHKISFPPRAGAISILLKHTRHETPLGIKLFFPITQAEKRNAYRKHGSVGLTKTILQERNACLDALISLLQKSILEADPVIALLAAYKRRGHLFAPLQKQFVEYYQSCLRFEELAILSKRQSKISQRNILILATKTNSKIKMYLSGFNAYLSDFLRTNPKITITLAKNIAQISQELNAQVNKLLLNMSLIPAEKEKNEATLRSFVRIQVDKLLSKKEPFNKQEFNFLDAIFSCFSAAKQISDRIAIDPIDLEIVKDPTLTKLDPLDSKEIKPLQGFMILNKL